ncbi:MAG: hypothetical protein ACJAX5_003145 [Patiriisocius sp.]|jgi:hypothetical protein
MLEDQRFAYDDQGKIYFKVTMQTTKCSRVEIWLC